MRRSDRGDFKNSSFSRPNNYRDNRNERYHDDKYRTSANKSFDSHRSDFKKPRRDYDNSYQDRRVNSRDHHHHRYEGERSFHRPDRKDERPSYRNHSSPPPRSREREGGYSRGGAAPSFRSSDIRQRLSSPPPSRIRSEYKPATTGIKSRLAPRISSIATRRIPISGGSRIIRRTDLRPGMITKRTVAPVNRAKEYAKKIRQARMKLSENGTNSCAKTASETENKSIKGSEENNEDDFLAIANDVNFDDDDRESTTGNKMLKNKVKEENESEFKSNAGEEDDNEDEKKKKKAISDEPSTSKDSGKEIRSSRHSKSRTRSLSNERIRKPFERIEYVCIHCGKRSNSAQEYRSHLSGRKHLLAMRNVGLRVRATLNRLRKVQRDKQLEIEAMIKDVENIPSKYCQICKLNYRQSKDEHHESEDHKKIRSFLKPYCKICRMQLISPMKYEVHRCHTDHIRRKLKAQEASEDEINLENMDIGDFKTVDSVGNVDDDETNEDADKEDKIIGVEMVSKIKANYCSLCVDFICRDGDEAEKELIVQHCKSRRHIHRFYDYKRDEGRKEVKPIKKEMKSPEKVSSKLNGSEMKHEKNDSNEVDRDADVNLDENTYEESENAEDN